MAESNGRSVGGMSDPIADRGGVSYHHLDVST